MNAMEILVIILSIFLAIFLIIAIVLGVLLIKLSLQIRRVADKAESTASQVQSFAANVTKFSSPMLIAKMVADQLKKVRK